eukprot:Rhum_TRINITY_DN8465_c0_g1::Rhum_TRINITY_DN8465_c0_g1_i1::g.28042::m.28042
MARSAAPFSATRAVTTRRTTYLSRLAQHSSRSDPCSWKNPPSPQPPAGGAACVRPPVRLSGSSGARERSSDCTSCVATGRSMRRVSSHAGRADERAAVSKKLDDGGGWWTPPPPAPPAGGAFSIRPMTRLRMSVSTLSLAAACSSNACVIASTGSRPTRSRTPDALSGWCAAAEERRGSDAECAFATMTSWYACIRCFSMPGSDGAAGCCSCCCGVGYAGSGGASRTPGWGAGCVAVTAAAVAVPSTVSSSRGRPAPRWAAISSAQRAGSCGVVCSRGGSCVESERRRVFSRAAARSARASCGGCARSARTSTSLKSLLSGTPPPAQAVSPCASVCAGVVAASGDCDVSAVCDCDRSTSTCTGTANVATGDGGAAAACGADAAAAGGGVRTSGLMGDTAGVLASSCSCVESEEWELVQRALMLLACRSTRRRRMDEWVVLRSRLPDGTRCSSGCSASRASAALEASVRRRSHVASCVSAWYQYALPSFVCALRYSPFRSASCTARPMVEAGEGGALPVSSPPPFSEPLKSLSEYSDIGVGRGWGGRGRGTTTTDGHCV